MPTIKQRPRLLAEKVVKVVGSLFAFGRHPFDRADEADGIRIGGYRLVRGDDGRLYGIAEPGKPTHGRGLKEKP